MLRKVMAGGTLVVDTRTASEYATTHVPGTINIPLDKSFNTWAGWFLPFDADFYLIIDDACTHCVDEAARDLAMIGLDRIAGYFGTGVVDEFTADGKALESIPQLTANQLAERAAVGQVRVFDVRGRAEWDEGHIPGASNIPVGHLADRIAEVPSDVPVVVHCQSGARSAIAASILQAAGRTNVANLTGGIADWRRGGNPVERGTEAVAVGE